MARRLGTRAHEASVPIAGNHLDLRALVSRGRPEPDNQFSWYAAAVLDFDALRLSPLTTSVVLSPLAGARRPPRAGRRAAPLLRRAASTYRASAFRSSSACCAFRSISYSAPSSAKRTVTLCLTAIDVIDEQGLYLLSHVYSVPLVE